MEYFNVIHFRVAVLCGSTIQGVVMIEQSWDRQRCAVKEVRKAEHSIDYPHKSQKTPMHELVLQRIREPGTKSLLNEAEF